MRVREATLHFFEELDAKVFRRRDVGREFREDIQIFVVVASEKFTFDKAI
jgi:hypothetical protein